MTAKSFNQFRDLFAATDLQLLLLIGSGILAISLLVLALTRWGHSRPVWKCVILSFVAHILLMGYAYGTRLMFQTPIVQPAQLMRVNLVEENGESLDGTNPLESSEKSWNQFVIQPELPLMDNLERPAIDSEIVIEKSVDRSVSKPDSVNSDTAIGEFPREFPDTEFAQVPLPSATERPLISPDVQPQEIEIHRRGEDTNAQKHEPRFETPREIARQEIHHGFSAPSPKEQSPGLMMPTDDANPFVSELIDSRSELPFAEESLPRPELAPKFDEVESLRPFQSRNRMRLVSNPRRIGDGQPLPKVYALRNAKDRLMAARKRGGSIQTEQAVELALKWLAENQEDDGRWDSRKSGGGREDQVFGHDRKGAGAQAECGITALATLCFLAAGESHLEGQYQNEVREGLQYLVRQQKSNGDLSGDARMFARMYCHSMSLLALGEALAMTGDQRLMSAVQRGVDYSVAVQNRRDGGWRYQPGDSGDMSQFGWQVLALHSARLGNAVVPSSTFYRMERFLESCASGIGNGLASYRPRQGPSTTMTAEALLCRFILQQNVAPTTRAEATRRILSERPTPHHINLYYWYYGTLAMYHAGGDEWDQWNTRLKSTLLQLQHRNGLDAGSWPANGVWGGYGGQVYATAMATLSLEVYYRYLPIYSEVAGANGTSGTARR